MLSSSGVAPPPPPTTIAAARRDSVEQRHGTRHGCEPRVVAHAARNRWFRGVHEDGAKRAEVQRAAHQQARRNNAADRPVRVRDTKANWPVSGGRRCADYHGMSGECRPTPGQTCTTDESALCGRDDGQQRRRSTPPREDHDARDGRQPRMDARRIGNRSRAGVEEDDAKGVEVRESARQKCRGATKSAVRTCDTTADFREARGPCGADHDAMPGGGPVPLQVSSDPRTVLFVGVRIVSAAPLWAAASGGRAAPARTEQQPIASNPRRVHEASPETRERPEGIDCLGAALSLVGSAALPTAWNICQPLCYEAHRLARVERRSSCGCGAMGGLRCPMESPRESAAMVAPRSRLRTAVGPAYRIGGRVAVMRTSAAATRTRPRTVHLGASAWPALCRLV
jgi:hypothetical protein